MRIIIFVLCLVFVLPIFATIINIPADQPTIQNGIYIAVEEDTVLVQPGTYIENINFNGKNIIVASVFLTTQDTSYISQTIIDGNQEDCVVKFENDEDSTAVLCGFTIQNGLGEELNQEIGGGINCNNSHPKILFNRIINNVGDPGGGIGCYQSNAVIIGNLISNNLAYSSWMTNRGGGISCISSNPIIRNNIISNNSLNWGNGGGIFCSNSNPLIEDCTITGNENDSYLAGAGVYCINSSPIIKNVSINNNSGELGGGIYFHNSDTILENVTISNNFGFQGGGIYIEENSNPMFDVNNRCNIYGNRSVYNLGVDLYVNSNLITNVTVDMFSVLYPNNYYFYSEGIVNFDIQHCYTVQIEDDVFVSSQGNNNNSGLSWNDPFKTLTYAISRIRADSLHHYSIYLADDTFSSSSNDEQFPIFELSYLDIVGSGIETTVLDGENEHTILQFIDVTNSNISNCTITNGYAHNGSGAKLASSEVNFENVKFANNNSYSRGGGIYAISSNSSINNSIIEYNTANYGGGIYFSNGNLEIYNTSIYENFSEKGAGLLCNNSNIELEDVYICNNSASDSGGAIYLQNCNSNFNNVSINNNSSNQFGGGIYCVESIINFENENRCSIYDNEIDFRGYGKDIFAVECESMDVILDTFTVTTPTDYFASPISIFNFDILNSTQGALVNSDLFVSLIGDDTNSGTSVEDPLQTINCALSKIYADSLNQNTIHLSSGIFSYENTGEIFPIEWSDFVNLEGSEEGTSVLHGNEQEGVLVFNGVSNSVINNISISNSYPEYAVGISMNYSSPVICNITVTGISRYGISCQNSSNPILYNVSIDGNLYGFGCSYSSNPIIINSLISNNSSIAFYSGYDSNPTFINTTIVNNILPSYIRESSANLFNCILSNEHIYEIDVFQNSSVTIAYSNIQGGIDAVHAWVNSIVYWEEGNIDEDPLFVGAGEHPFALSGLSPCIDTGTPDTTGLNLPPWDIISNERIWDGNEDGITVIDMGCYEFGAPPYVDLDDNVIVQLPKVLLRQNYPNPFNPSTTISFLLQNNSNVELTIYNIKGQKVKQLVSDLRTAGQHSVIWNGKDDSGKPVSSGVYFYKLNVNNNIEAVKKCLLLK